MIKSWKNSVYIAGIALFGVIVASGSTAMADVDVDINAEITSTMVETLGNDMDFGSIELSPTGNTIVTIAAAGGIAPAVADNGSVVTPGTFGSGLVTVASAIDLTIGIAVTDTVNLSGAGADIPFTGGIANSTPTGLSHTGGDTSNIHVGGIITIPGGQTPGVYSATITVVLTYT